MPVERQEIDATPGEQLDEEEGALPTIVIQNLHVPNTATVTDVTSADAWCHLHGGRTDPDQRAETDFNAVIAALRSAKIIN